MIEAKTVHSQETLERLGIAPSMTLGDCDAIHKRHGLRLLKSGAWEIATVLGGLEAEIAALQTQCESFSAFLLAIRGENAKLRAENKKLRLALADGTLFESDSHIDSMIATITNIESMVAKITDTTE
jgi:regulator of replication initiation timing